jgi:hypothetical protein
MMVPMPAGPNIEVRAPRVSAVVRAMAPMPMTIKVVPMTVPTTMADLLNLAACALGNGSSRHRCCRGGCGYEGSCREGDEAACQRRQKGTFHYVLLFMGVE